MKSFAKPTWAFDVVPYVHPSGQISPFQNSLADDDYIPGFRKLAETVHHEGAKIAVQQML
jgi:2,4-dienoyl-CoA reductase-like NADH-dependent reductase (Old Yellow Enzyme family)